MVAALRHVDYLYFMASDLECDNALESCVVVFVFVY
jgi:hypothetical protein